MFRGSLERALVTGVTEDSALYPDLELGPAVCHLGKSPSLSGSQVQASRDALPAQSLLPGEEAIPWNLGTYCRDTHTHTHTHTPAALTQSCVIASGEMK